MTTITASDLGQLIRRGQPIEVIDVRTPIEFREVHLTLARNIPLDQLDPSQIMKDRLLGKDEPLYLICRSGARGKKACEQFLAAGYSNVVNIEGGTQACVEAGLPVTRGKGVLPLERQVRIIMGTLILLGIALGLWVHPAFLSISAFFACGLIFSGLTNWCGIAMIVAKAPWNRTRSEAPPTCAMKT